MTCDSLQVASDAISNTLASTACVASASSIMVFLPLPREVDLRKLVRTWIDEGKSVSVPIVKWKSKSMQPGLLTSLEPEALVATKHSLLEPREKHPVPPESLDIVIVPGLAFDSAGGRLGRGGGFYDRFLALVRPPVSIGVAFEEQIVDHVELEPHDQQLTAIATPKGLLT